MNIVSKYQSRCTICGKIILAGIKIEWEKGAGARHIPCSAGERPALNRPLTAQTLAPDTDIPALVRSHGREVAPEATVRHINFRGRQAKKAGTVENLKGKPYMVLSTSRPQYLSRDYFEDMDMFNRQPGYWYEARVIEVVPTAGEAADKTKTEGEEAERKVLQTSLRDSYRAEDITTLPAGCTEIWGSHRMGGSEAWYLAPDGTVYRRQSSYDDGPSVWRTTATREQIARAEALGVKAV